MNAKQTAAIKSVADIIVEVVKVYQEKGVPEGDLCDAMSSKIHPTLFYFLVGDLIKAGKIKSQNHLLTAV